MTQPPWVKPTITPSNGTPDRPYSKRWVVTLLGDKARVIFADYYRVDCGHLVFRNRKMDDYPTPISCFAAGQWIEVTNADPER